MRQLEEQRRERERLERGEAQRKKEQEEIEALKAILRRSYKATGTPPPFAGKGLVLPAWVMVLGVSLGRGRLERKRPP